jgi:hypothetical protein
MQNGGVDLLLKHIDTFQFWLKSDKNKTLHEELVGTFITALVASGVLGW